MSTAFKLLLANNRLIFYLRVGSGLVWFGTAIRRIFIQNFEERIIKMAEGTTLFPKSIMDWAVLNWNFVFAIVLIFEIIISFSLILGLFARFGSFLATINGFGIGMAGLGLGVIDLLIPWLVAVVTLFLFLFTHPGTYKGIDETLQGKKLPKIVEILI